MTGSEFLKLSWNQYLILESDLTKVMRYIAFEENNFKTYSVEFIKQYEPICAEIDVLCKLYCQFLEPSSRCADIMDYADILLRNRPNIKNAVVLCEELQLKPWIQWSSDSQDPRGKNNPLNVSPVWWHDYNKVKHQRLDRDPNGEFWYTHANLENVLNALAALLVVCLNFYKDICINENNPLTVPTQTSELLKYKDWETNIIPIFDGGFMQLY